MERSDGKGLNDFIHPSSSSVSDSGLFDASQYAFFGKGVVDEVELGGLEDEDEDVPVIGGKFGGEDELNEYHLFDKDEGSGLGSLSDMDDLATTFAKSVILVCHLEVLPQAIVLLVWYYNAIYYDHDTGYA
ncbi:UNVERIFIED_CONTAM: protein PAT11 [Sesamum calycinum]|uniref:Protein PAT11 n=1 Tax=Sesamum calycinum TaxID=2727403 RepID=A0AAW2Q3A4_9LAMI